MDIIHSLTIARFIILDDFYYHYGSPVDYDATFTDIITTLSLQLVTSHTHVKNNILDLVIIPKTNTFSITNLIISTLITDHYSIHFKLNTADIPKRVTILYKKLSNIDHDLFQNEFLSSSDLLQTITLLL